MRSFAELADAQTIRGPLRVVEVGPGRFPEERDVLVAVGSERSPSIFVKYFDGRPDDLVSPWIEAALPRDHEGFVADVAMVLAALLPPGGRLMIVYGHDETERALQSGIPPAATPIGHALVVAGCSWLKDWYFAEGGREGETKLQGNLPLGEADRQSESDRLERELRSWLATIAEPGGELIERARRRAEVLIANLPRG